MNMRMMVSEGYTTCGWSDSKRKVFYKEFLPELLPEYQDIMSWDGMSKDLPMLERVLVSPSSQAKGFNRIFKDLQKTGEIAGTDPDSYKFTDKVKLYQEYILSVNKRSTLVFLTTPWNKRINEIASASFSNLVIYIESFTFDWTEKVWNISADCFEKDEYLSMLDDMQNDPEQIVVGKTLKGGEEVPMHLCDMHKFADTDPRLVDKVFELSAIVELPEYTAMAQYLAPNRDASGLADLYDHPYERGNYAGFKMNYRIGGIDPDDVPGVGSYTTKMSRKNLQRYYGKYSNCTKQDYSNTKEYVDAVAKFIAESKENLEAMLDSDEQLVACPNCGCTIRHSENPLVLLKGRYKYCPFCGYDVDKDILDPCDWEPGDENRYLQAYDEDDYEFLQNMMLGDAVDSEDTDDIEDEAE